MQLARGFFPEISMPTLLPLGSPVLQNKLDTESCCVFGSSSTQALNWLGKAARMFSKQGHAMWRRSTSIGCSSN